MAFEIRKAERRKAKLRLGIAGASGSGKTASSLLIAYGMTGDWGKIGFIDTENGRGELYVGAVIGGTKIGQYLYGRINAPYTPAKYIEAIKVLENALGDGGVIIIDSLSHAWAGEGGLLEIQGREADRTGNSWSAWRKVTPEHNRLVDSLIQSKCHIITTMRAKTEYTQVEDERGKKQVKKLGMAPIQRDGMEYEFTVFFDIDAAHHVTPSKDNTNLFDGQYFKPTTETGKALLQWLETGADAPPPEKPQVTPAPAPAQAEESNQPAYITDAQRKRLFAIAKEHGYRDDEIKAYLMLLGFQSSKEITTDVYDSIVSDFETKRVSKAEQTTEGG